MTDELSRRERQRAVAEHLHQAAIRLLRRLRREDDAAGSTPARLSALSVLVFAGPMRLSALAAAEGVRVPTMSRLVAALARDGLLTRVAERGDARAASLRPTAKGRRLMLQGKERRLAVLVAMLQELAEADLESLDQAARVLGRMDFPGCMTNL
jgi:DNA-binding MarR family transcriptional regulator